MKNVFEAFDAMINEWNQRMPNDLFEAKQSRAGKRQYGLSEARAAKMLEKYGGGKYEVAVVVKVKEPEEMMFS